MKEPDSEPDENPILAGLREFVEAVKSGVPLEERFRVRKVRVVDGRVVVKELGMGGTDGVAGSIGSVEMPENNDL